MNCPKCAFPQEPGRKFCGECGFPLGGDCPRCGRSNTPGTKFCGECGSNLASSGTTPAPVPTDVVPPSAERRLVSVLFADLVGFTTISESRDPETVRELLGSYFATATSIVGTYGGTVEKFIGDAVMALWGAPTAHEDDAERAVRAALDLVEAVSRMGEQAGAELRLRAGVLTGEAAVTLGATNQGMVAGDLVNSASRLQSVATPGTVLVGERTYQAASGAIAFEPAGEQVLKGKGAALSSYQALRVVARRGGAGRSKQLEAPFVGRARELRLLKEFHVATAIERRPRLVSIIGQGGIGKSRLLWEFQKYLDGLTEVVYWHQGRCPAYGEGISFWALAEMVRSRAHISESEDPASARERLAAALVEWVTDDDERRWLEPRLLQLLGLETSEVDRPERESLFAAWRIFFERIAERGVVVMVFEDLQWADGGVLDFIDHLVDWSRDRPIYLITLARPELLDRRTDWGLGRRSFTSLGLEPLDDASMRELLDGLVPGLPEAVTARVLERAEGVPLYAVETVRMLIAEGRVTEVEGTYRPVGDLSDLSVPASLHALIAARLDALDPADRGLLHAASVIGKTFSVEAVAAVHGQAAGEVSPRLRALVRREVLSLEADPRSPEQGQFGFVQGLIREVAYGTLARRERCRLHLAAARYFETLEDDGLAGAVSEHYLAAYRAQPDGGDGEAAAALARVALRRAGDRARSLGSFAQALRFSEQALEVTSDLEEEQSLRVAAGNMALNAGLQHESLVHMDRALELARQLGDRRQVLRAVTRSGIARGVSGLVTESLELLEPARQEFADLSDTVEFVQLNAELARSYMLTARPADAVRVVDETLPAAERLQLTREILELLVTRGPSLSNLGRLREGTVTLTGAVTVSASRDMPEVELRARVNLSYVAAADDPVLAYGAAREGLVLARHLGYRSFGFFLLANAAESAVRIGDWDWALSELEEAVATLPTDFMALLRRAHLRGLRGDVVEDDLRAVDELVAGLSDVQPSAAVDDVRAQLALARGDFAEAFHLAQRSHSRNSAADSYALPSAGRAAAWLGNIDDVAEVCQLLRQQPGRVPAVARQEIESAWAAMEGRTGESLAGFGEAIRRWRELGLEFEAAVCALDLVMLLGSADGEGREAADEAAATFKRVGAKPLLHLLTEATSGFASAT